MDLFIETLTGTAFELRVSPNDTVISIKSKIQRVEGIPVGQQHLIWRNGELSDHQSLRDYSIPGGATLRLVLGLRGGPINTYRTPTLRLTPIHFTPPSSMDHQVNNPGSSSERSVAMTAHAAVLSGHLLSHRTKTTHASPPGGEEAPASEAPTERCGTHLGDPPLEAAGKGPPVHEPPLNPLSPTLDAESTSASRGKHLTLLIFTGGEGVNLLHVLDREEDLGHPDRVEIQKMYRKGKTKSRLLDVDACPGSSGECRSDLDFEEHSVDSERRQLGTIPAQHADGTGAASPRRADSPEADFSLPPADCLFGLEEKSLLSAEQSPPRMKTAPASTTALLAGLLYAAGSKLRPGSPGTDEGTNSEGERSSLQHSCHWLYPASQREAYDAGSVYRRTYEEIDSGLNEELPFFEEDSEGLFSAGGAEAAEEAEEDDDSLADLEDYFLFYRTGDVLFGPSPRQSILRDSLLSAVDPSYYRSTRLPGLQNSRYEERRSLAEKVKNLKTEMSRSRKNRLSRQRATSDSPGHDTNLPKTPQALTHSDPLDAAAETGPVEEGGLYSQAAESAVGRPHTASTESLQMQPHPQKKGQFGLSKRHSFDAPRPGRTAPPAPSKATSDSDLISSSQNSSDHQPKTPTSSIGTFRGRQLGRIQTPNLPRVNDTLFPSLFPAASSKPRSRFLNSEAMGHSTSYAGSRSRDLELPPLSPNLKQSLPINVSKGLLVQTSKPSTAEMSSVISKATPRPLQTVLLHGPDKNADSNSTRCATCNRKTGLANSYTCRCGHNYCMRHRYAELHACPYDYKGEARRCLRDSNPVVAAAKLPKI